MDDQKTQNQKQQNQQDQTDQSIALPQTPTQPIGSLHKEGGPVSATSEFLTPTQENIEVGKELKEIGVEASEVEDLPEQA